MTLWRRCWYRAVHFQVPGDPRALCGGHPAPAPEAQRYEPPWQKRTGCVRCFDRLEALRRQGPIEIVDPRSSQAELEGFGGPAKRPSS